MDEHHQRQGQRTAWNDRFLGDAGKDGENASIADMGASKGGATATPKMLILKEAENLKFEMVLHSFRFQDFHHRLCISGDYGTAGISALKHW